MTHHFPEKPDLIRHSTTPFNGEPTLQALRSNLITAVRYFYVRSHGNIPAIKEHGFKLEVRGERGKALHLTMKELRTLFPRRVVNATLQCAGNRRRDMLQVRTVSGDPWAPGAIGNAKWTGASLREVLEAAGVDLLADRHVVFNACDECEVEGDKFRYSASIPLRKAASPEVLLAYEMNGKPLTAEHGFPLRAIVPGYAGVRSPKWLTSIVVQSTPSKGHIQARDYKLFPSDVTKESADWDKGMTINELPINAAICIPEAYAALKAGPTTIKGYAVVSGREITRVEVSVDGGRVWQQAGIERDHNAPWSWVFWQLDADLPKGDLELIVRAWDSAGQTQPALPDDTWNFKGYLSTAWHRVKVIVS